MSFSIFAAPSDDVSITRLATLSAFPSFAARYSIAVLGLALTVSLLASTANAVYIDDFSDPAPGTNYVINFLDPDPLVMKQQPLPVASTVGGERDLLVDVLGPVTSISASGTVGGGTYQFGTTGSSGSSATLQYDGIDNLDTASALVNAEGLSFDLTNGGADNGLRFKFLSVDGAAAGSIDIRITATSAGASASYVGTVLDNPGVSNFDVLLAALTPVGPFDPTAVTSIQVTFNESGVRDVDFELDHIATTTVIPEPSSLALLGCGGLAGLMVLRRRRAK